MRDWTNIEDSQKNRMMEVSDCIVIADCSGGTSHGRHYFIEGTYEIFQNKRLCVKILCVKSNTLSVANVSLVALIS